MRAAALFLGGLVFLSIACGGGSHTNRSSAKASEAAPTITLPPIKRGTPEATVPPLPGTDVKSWGLVSARSGWALTDRELEWTSDDGATWRNIKPPDLAAKDLVGTFFLDEQHGWTSTVESVANDYAPAKVTIYRTSDGGATWQRGSFEGPDIADPGPPVFSGTMQFVDDQHGWYHGYYVTGMMHWPRLYRTTDGGVTWQPIPSPRDAYQWDVWFATANDGWFAAEKDQPLFVTHDGGEMWMSVPLQIPNGCQLAAGGDGSMAPVFEDTMDGTVVVRGLCPGEQETSWFFTTADGGNSWVLASTISEKIKASVIDPSNWIYVADGRLSDEISVTDDGGKTWQSFHSQVNVYRATFISRLDGWAWLAPINGVAYRVIATSDGGHTWRILSP